MAKMPAKILLFAFYCLIAGMLLLIVEIVFTLKLLYDNYLRSFDNTVCCIWIAYPGICLVIPDRIVETELQARA